MRHSCAGKRALKGKFAMIVDAWMQHPTQRLMEQPWLASLKRWTRNDFAGEWPLSETLTAMDEGGVEPVVR